MTPESLAWTDRLRALRPVAYRMLGWVRMLALLSAAAALVLLWLLVGGWLFAGSGRTALSLAVLAALLVPAAGTALAVWSVRGLLALPERLAALPGQAAGAARTSASDLAAARQGGSAVGRATGFLGVLWRLRRVVLDARGTLLRIGGLARFARFGSFGFVFFLGTAFLLNFAVIGLALAAILLRVTGVT
jgi:hypothetical protein